MTAVVLLFLLAGFSCSRLPPAPLESAVELEVMEQAPEIAGRDGGYSALLWGHSVWNFGDTVGSTPSSRSGRWCSSDLACARIPPA